MAIDWTRPIRMKDGREAKLLPDRTIHDQRRVMVHSRNHATGQVDPKALPTVALYTGDSGISRCDGAESGWDLENL